MSLAEHAAATKPRTTTTESNDFIPSLLHNTRARRTALPRLPDRGRRPLERKGVGEGEDVFVEGAADYHLGVAAAVEAMKVL